jgi:hypothetical protein
MYRLGGASPADVADGVLLQLYPQVPTPFEQLWAKQFADTSEADADSIDLPYLLLHAIHTACRESQAMSRCLANKAVVERLLVCGVFCDPVSMVSSQAFRLVAVAGIDFTDELESFADAFTFCNPPVPQVIAAVPIFWRHRYPGRPETLKVGRREVDMGGSTPLEMFNHYLLQDPAWSDALNFQIMRILVAEEKRIQTLRQNGADLFGEDAMFLRFLSHKFQARRPLPPHVTYGMGPKEDDVVKDADMSFASHLLEALPDDPVLVERSQKSRAPLNGYLYKFIRFWQKSSMFRTGGDDNQMSDVAPKLSVGAEAAALNKRRFNRILKEDIKRAAGDEGVSRRLEAPLRDTCPRSPPYEPAETVDLDP